MDKEFKSIEDLNRELSLMEGKPFEEILRKMGELYSYAKANNLLPERDLMESLEHKIKMKKVLNSRK
ncbi:MAG: hypothetical protein JSS63_07440 [Bacteroidetes bacterium]|nr:hypothetical protein [Bacteroidota bacterium]